MSGRKRRTRRGRNGAAYVIALLLLTLLFTLAIGMATTADLSLQKGENCRKAAEARMAAESGLAFMLQVLEDVRLPGSTTSENFYENLQAVLAARLDNTANFAGETVLNTGASVFVPDCTVDGKSFCSWFTQLTENTCQLKVRGSYGGIGRHLTVELSLQPELPAAFDYGLACRGPISISGNARILGVNDSLEASVLTCTQQLDALQLSGNTQVSGDLYVVGSDSYVTVSENAEVAGHTDPVQIAEHVHQGVDSPDFPQIDVSPIAALATYTLQPTDPNNQSVLNNVRIPAGMNPTFASDITINGVIYVEAPNVVSFESKCTLNGIVVTQDNTEPIDNCRLWFGGNVEAFGVDALPDTPEFAAVKEQRGTFIAAPGFSVTFSGNFSAINGSIAADQLTFSGTAEGVVNGSVIALKDLPTTISGTVDIYVDRQSVEQDPAGFIKSIALVVIPDSYVEATE
ncbi:MAG: hypothetical protein ACYTF6_02105 [Planctomycetota bacterium]|jgi:Tfp pilus assembly protein PilX